VRRHRQVTLDEVRQAMELFEQLRAQGEDWADVEQTVAEHLCIERSTCRRWRARWRAGDMAWFGPLPANTDNGGKVEVEVEADVLALLHKLLN
jgi:hypothetical protein